MDLQKIRNTEKQYHDHLYTSKKLGEVGSWLKSPVKKVLDNLEL